MQLGIREEEGQSPRRVSSPSRREVEDGLEKRQMRTSRDAITARRDSRVDGHPEGSFYTW